MCCPAGCVTPTPWRLSSRPRAPNSQTWVPATGTSRPDTAVACGPRTTDTGYGLLFNWNRLGDGEHTVRVLMDDVVVAERRITVTTLGPHPEQEFRQDLAESQHGGRLTSRRHGGDDHTAVAGPPGRTS